MRRLAATRVCRATVGTIPEATRLLREMPLCGAAGVKTMAHPPRILSAGAIAAMLGTQCLCPRPASVMKVDHGGVIDVYACLRRPLAIHCGGSQMVRSEPPESTQSGHRPRKMGRLHLAEAGRYRSGSFGANWTKSCRSWGLNCPSERT